MTLRSRLVAALSLLLLIGLAGFSVVTYGLFARTQYRQLDDQLRSAVEIETFQLLESAGLGNNRRSGDSDGNRNGSGTTGGRGPKPTAVVPTGAYAELRDASGAVVPNGSIQSLAADTLPDLTGSLPPAGTIRTVDAVSGAGEWHVITAAVADHPGYSVIVAFPTTNVTNSLRRLLLIEAVAGVLLLAGLASGAWLILRGGLRPLETMATTARSINTGDLTQRVATEGPDGRGEVGQLGLALNTMLDEIQASFLQRDATEAKLRRFLSDVSHELRTPLTSIQGFAELFRMGVDHPHVDQTVIMRRIEQESARMKRLVEDLLLLARLDETRPIERESVDLTILAADACSDAAAIDPDRPIRLNADAPVVIDGDRDHLRQAITNLVGNALKHTPAGTALEVGTRRVGTSALVVVRDHGSGLTDEALAHVFDRFWQADTARVGAGAGLGLSIVAAIAHEHGGTATVRNHPEGGAEFTMTIPLEVAGV